MSTSTGVFSPTNVGAVISSRASIEAEGASEVNGAKTNKNRTKKATLRPSIDPAMTLPEFERS
jgi:hypothetical protein